MYSRFLLILAVLTSFAVHAVSQVQAPSSSAKDYSSEAYVIEHSAVRILAEADGGGTRELTAEIKILADAGVKNFAVLDFPYTSASEVVDIDYVRVRKQDGSTINTPEYNVQDMPADITRTAPMYSDLHEKHVAVKGLGVGDILEYKVRYRITKPQVPGHFWFEFTFSKDEIVKDSRIEFSVPKDKYVKVSSPEVRPKVREEGERRIYLWEHSNLERKIPDPKEIPKRTTPNPDVQLTTFASWGDIGKWYDGLQQDPLNLTPAIQAKAAELTKGLKTDDEKIRAIYSYVSLRFHYVGLAFGIGRYKPHAADDVLGNEYGDCKDKHTLLAALLKAAGYDAWPALIHSTRKLNPDVPSPQQFDHVITVISNGGKLTWVDTTPEVAPFGLLLNILRGKQALVIPTGKPPVLMETPATSELRGDQSFVSEGKLGADGTFKGHVEMTTRGDNEILLRTAFRQVPQAQWKELVQGISYRLGFGGEVSNVQVAAPDKTDTAFQLSYDYERKSYSDWEHKQITPPLPPIGVEANKDTADRKPTEPVFLGLQGEIIYRSKVELPPGYSIAAPKNLNLVEPYAEYHTTNTLEFGTLKTTRRLVIKKSEIAPSEWPGYVKFGRAVNDDEFDYLRLTNKGSKSDEADDSLANVAELDRKFSDGAEALRRNDGKRAQELFQQVIAGEPKYHGAHFNLGLAFWYQSRLDEALKAMREEEEVTPDDSRAYRAAAELAGILKQDAASEWRKLLKANPKDHEAALTLAQLLSSDEKYPEAIQLLESSLRSAQDSPSLHLALGTAYLKDRQTEKALPHLREAAERDVDLLNEVAWNLAESGTNLEMAKGYAEKAVAELEKRSAVAPEDSESNRRITGRLSNAWDTLGWLYFLSGDAAKAENYVRPAWILSQRGVVGDHLGQIYEKLAKPKEAAHVYALALASSDLPIQARRLMPSITAKYLSAERDRILSHHKRLTGKVPTTAITRLPNGQWTMTPSEELSRARETKLGNQRKLTGSAEFFIVFALGKVESVRFIDGDSEMNAMQGTLQQASYRVEFPVASTAKIARRMAVSCNPSIGCSAVLFPPEGQ